MKQFDETTSMELSSEQMKEALVVAEGLLYQLGHLDEFHKRLQLNKLYNIEENDGTM